MFYALRRRLGKQAFSWRSRGIFETPPIQQRRTGVRIVSLLRDADVAMYLLAIKSFYRFLPGAEITVIDDGTLNESHRELLKRQLGGPEIVPIASIETGRCPRGGCWERLLYILDISRDNYVIQLDADMLTTTRVPEVVEAAEANRAFTLAGSPGLQIVSLEEAAAAVAGEPDYMQILAERALPQLPLEMGRLYVRGSAGFAGFARGGPSRAEAEAFSVAMEEMLGERWSEWGSEQVTSNYIVCNSPGGLVLPWPKYVCFAPGVAWQEAAMFHFIGTWRFDDGIYAAKAKQVIASLRGAQSAGS